MTWLSAPLARIALVWLVLAVILIARAWSAIGELRFPDPDDVLRIVQVRDLLAGQSWYDLHQYRIDGPAGTLMHWSRLVDLPLALVIAALSPLVGQDTAELIAGVALPIVTLGAIVFVVAGTASRFMTGREVTLACLCLGLAPALLVQLQPLRIDHHGWQVFTVVLALGGLACMRGVRGPVLSGIALGVGLSISLEVLPIAAAFGAVLVLRWLADGVTRAPFVAFLAALAVTLALTFLATRGFADLARHCDAISPAHIGLFAIVAGGAGIVARFNPRSRSALVAALGAPVVAGAGFYIGLAPECMAGPFGNLDPVLREFWYENVAEGRPAWRLPTALWLPVVAQGLIAIAALAWLWRNRSGEGRRFWFEYLVILLATFASALLVWRSFAFVGALSAIPLGWLTARLLEALGNARTAWRKVLVALGMLFALLPSFPFAMANLIAPAGNANAGANAGPAGAGACRLTESADALNALPAAKIFAPMDLGPAVLFHSPHGVVATAHHRARLAMSDVVTAFLGTPDEARAVVRRHGAEYVMLCAGMGEVELYRKRAPAGFAARLVSGDVPDWLEQVELEGPPQVHLWRVRPGGTS